MDKNFSPDEYSREKKLSIRYGVAGASLWRWAADENNPFPKPYKLSPGVTAWKNSELIEWEKNRTKREEA